MRGKTKYSEAFQDYQHFFLPNTWRMIYVNKRPYQMTLNYYKARREFHNILNVETILWLLLLWGKTTANNSRVQPNPPNLTNESVSRGQKEGRRWGKGAGSLHMTHNDLHSADWKLNYLCLHTAKPSLTTSSLIHKRWKSLNVIEKKTKIRKTSLFFVVKQFAQ